MDEGFDLAVINSSLNPDRYGSRRPSNGRNILHSSSIDRQAQSSPPTQSLHTSNPLGESAIGTEPSDDNSDKKGSGKFVSFGANTNASSRGSTASRTFQSEASSFNESFGGVQGGDRVCYIATTYRVFYFVLGMVPNICNLVRFFMTEDVVGERNELAPYLTWGGALFWPFSATCLLVCATSNPLKVKREANFIRFSGFAMGFAPLIGGIYLQEEHRRFGGDSQANIVFSYLWIAFGILICLIGPPGILHLVTVYSKLENEKLHNFITHGLFKKAPQALGSMLYVSSSGLRALVNAPIDNSMSLVARFGNPICPGFLISAYLWVIWLGTVLVPPVEHQSMSQTITWTNVMTLNIPKMKAFQGLCFAPLTFLTLLLFAFLEEDGSPMTLFVEYMTYAHFVFTSISIFMVFYDIAIGHIMHQKLGKGEMFIKEIYSQKSSAFDPQELGANKMVM